MQSGNRNIHPGMIDISIEEKRVDLPLNTPALRKKRAKSKNMRSAEEVEASIQQVTAYKRQSLKDKLDNVTPQPLVPPVTPWNSTKTHDVSDEEDGGNIMDNALMCQGCAGNHKGWQ